MPARGAALAREPARPGRAARGPDPLNPAGVARVLVVLTDGSGPLYNPAVADRMGDAVWWIADGLALEPDADPAAAEL